MPRLLQTTNKMVKRCVAHGCSAANDDGVSLHEWPKDENLAKLWSDFVRVDRPRWTFKTKTTVLCSRHFSKESFVINPVRESLGFGRKRPQLHIGAYPTIHACSFDKENFDPNPKQSALKKEERSRVVRTLFRDPRRDVTDHGLEECLDFEDDTEPDHPPHILHFREIGTHPNPVTRGDKAVLAKPLTRTVRVQAKINGCSKGSQVTPKTRDTGVQCELLRASTPTPSDEDMEISDDFYNSPSDASYMPSDSDSEDESEDSESFMDCELQGDIQETKFVVFLSMLLSLFRLCHMCGKAGTSTKYSVVGTIIVITQSCLFCEESFRWQSQPHIGNIPAGNLLLSAAILFSGATPSKALRMLRFWGVSTISASTFFSHQKTYLTKAIKNVWSAQQQELLETTQHSEITVGGDGRCDSMGHCAKYGSYGLLDLDRNKIVALELVQSNETGGSYGMELEGLQRCLKHLNSCKIKVTTIVTDRHPQIQKWLREHCTDMIHYFDIWHVAKGLKKKLVALGKKKHCGLVTKWIRSIINHLYWSAVSSNGNGREAWAKWQSIANHIADIHTGHSEVFPSCSHPEIKEKREWFQPGSHDYEQLADLIDNASLKKDVMKLSPLGQTSSIEGYHSVVNHFAPKMYHFGYDGMRCRLRLAALHYNENAQREQARDQSGTLLFNITFPKAKQGHHTVKKIMQECTFEYVQQLVDELMKICSDASDSDHLPDAVAPPPLSSQYIKPNKAEAIKDMYTRFAK